MRKKLESEKYYRWYATAIVKDLIDMIIKIINKIILELKLLKMKYNLKIIDYDEVNTIMFGSTCKHIVLSNGTFSWLIGFLAYYSTVYYPKIIHKWHGDIFIFDSWNEIEQK